MMSIRSVIDYWFKIEPYVFVGITSNCVLLYNTLDGVTIESDRDEVVDLLREALQVENCGVVLLTNDRYKKKDVKNFIIEIREKYMGDIIDVSLSKGKPVQLLPYFNFPNKHEIYKKHNFSPLKNVLEHLSEIGIHIDATTNVKKLVEFLKSIPGSLTFNIIGNIREVTKYYELLSFFERHPSPKNILCAYNNVFALQPDFVNNFSYRISVRFPIDKLQWNHSIQILLNQTCAVEYIFDVTSNEDCQKAEQLIEQNKIEKYWINPVYTGNNIRFFEENVFLTKEDILSTPTTIKDFFARQAINIYDFGKINIMPNFDAYANLNHPKLGNIYTDSLHEIVQKELDEGLSWFRTRNHAPCNNCVYQWLCPSPSNHEIAIGHPNLCHLKK